MSDRRRPVARLGGSALALGLCLAAIFGGPAVAQPTVYLGFGDSITEGFGDDEGLAEQGYLPRLRDLLIAAGQEAEVINAGVGGERTNEALTRIDEVLASESADVFLLMEGTNDISRSLSQESTLANLAELARKAEEAGLEVVHATLIPRLPGARVDPQNVLNQQMCEEIRHLAGSVGRPLVDPFEVFSTTAGLFSSLYYQGDDDPVGHPNAAGYDRLAEVFFDVITGVDSVPPVTGRMTPVVGETGVDPETAVQVDVRDFGTGIDLSSTRLLVNEVEVDATPVGDGDLAQLSFQPASPLSGIVRIGLRSQDQAVPANAVDREVSHFVIVGTSFLRGDLDEDGRVDGNDLVDFAIRFGARSSNRRYLAAADFNSDGVIDGADLAVLASNFGQSSL